MGDHNDSFGGRGQYLIVLTKAAGMIEPGKRPLHNPALGKLLSFVRLDFLRNINIKLKLLLQISYKSTQTSSICTEFLNRWVSFVCWHGGRDASIRIMDIGGVNDNRPVCTCTI